MTQTRAVFYVSDGTGITTETLGHTLLTQFPNTKFVSERIPFVDSEQRAREVVEEIKKVGAEHETRPIVVNTCMDPAIGEILASSGALMLDIIEPFMKPLEDELQQPRERRVGAAHSIVDFDKYHQRINAMNFALTYDDGQQINYDDADVILVAVSRAGKTPTCVYLALHYGIRAANYPLTEEDLEHDRIPDRLRKYRDKLFALTIDPVRLSQIRQERRPNSRYADIKTCRSEVAAAEAMFRAERIPTLSTTHKSIEELASKVLSTLHINREMF